MVTKMWPTSKTSFRNGFLELQVEALRKLDITCDVLVTQDHGSGLMGYARSAWAVRRAVSSGRYDIVHAHYGLTGASCLLQTLPLVVTLHGSDINGAVNSQGHKTIKGIAESLISRVVAWRADAVIAVSGRMAALIPRARPVVVPVGIDTDLFRPIPQVEARQALGLDHNKRYVLFAANPNNSVKRYWLAEQAVAAVERRLPDVQLVTVSGEPFKHMPLWMSAADVLIITSAYEGGPMIHREAMACNLPVVSVDVGDVALHVKGVDQSHVVADTPVALAEAIESVLEHASRSNGRDLAEKTNGELTAKVIRDIYRGLLVVDNAW